MISPTSSKIINCDDSVSVEEVKKIYNKEYNCDLKTTGKYDYFDIIDISNKIVIEVKHRNCSSTSYPTSIIPENKFIQAKSYKEKGYKVYFVVKFIDGIFEYEYSIEDKHSIHDIRNHQGGRQYVFIDIKKFKKL